MRDSKNDVQSNADLCPSGGGLETNREADDQNGESCYQQVKHEGKPLLDSVHDVIRSLGYVEALDVLIDGLILPAQSTNMRYAFQLYDVSSNQACLV